MKKARGRPPKMVRITIRMPSTLAAEIRDYAKLTGSKQWRVIYEAFRMCEEKGA